MMLGTMDFSLSHSIPSCFIIKCSVSVCVCARAPIVPKFYWPPQCVCFILECPPFASCKQYTCLVCMTLPSSKGCEMLRVVNIDIPIAKPVQESHIAAAHCHLRSPKPPRVGGWSSSWDGADDGWTRIRFSWAQLSIKVSSTIHPMWMQWCNGWYDIWL